MIRLLMWVGFVSVIASNLPMSEIHSSRLAIIGVIVTAAAAILGAIEAGADEILRAIRERDDA